MRHLTMIALLAILSSTLVLLPTRSDAKAHHIDCSDGHWSSLLQAIDDQNQDDHRGKMRAMVAAGETRAVCAEQSADQYGSMIDDAANQFDSAGDEAAILGDTAYSCTLHRRALTIENEALHRKLSSLDRATIKDRRDDTLRELGPCH